MIKSILASTTILLASVPAAFAGAPGVSITAVNTPYGQTTCMQRATNKFYVIGVTSIDISSANIWGYLNNSTLGVWCRGGEAIITVAGDNASTLRNEIKGVF